MITISFTFRRSRWVYGWQYAVFFALLVATLWLNDRAQDLYARIFGTVCLVMFVVLETLIRYERVMLSEKDLELKRGIRSVDIARVPYAHIKNVEVRQTSIGRFLHHGVLAVTTHERMVVTPDLDDPERVKDLLLERKQHLI